MPPVENPKATVEDVDKGQIVVRNFTLQVVDENGAVARARSQIDRLDYTSRNRPANLRPRPFLALLDRDEELATLKSAIQVSKSVSLHSPAGIGKTSLLRSLAHLPEAGGFPDGIVYLSIFEWGLEDVLHSLFTAFYESTINGIPVEPEIRSALKEVKALILLDDISLNRDQARTLLNGLTDCTFVLTSLGPSLGEEVENIALKGLPEIEALDLFVLELNRSLNDQEQAQVREICASLAGHPLSILQCASLVREKIATIAELKKQLQYEKPVEMILRIALDSFSDSQKNIISILAAAGGAALPVNHLRALSQSADLKADLQHLVSLGLVQAHDTEFSLAGDLSAASAMISDLNAWEDRLIEYLASWLKETTVEDLSDSVDLLLQVAQKAEKKNRWQDVIRLGRGLEPALIHSGRWQAWLDILNVILKAARSLGDRKAEAWALHQSGTRAACLGFGEPARGLLSQAQKIRRAIGDQAGLAVTQNNLHTFFNMPLSSIAGGSRGRRCLTYGAIGAGVFALISILGASLFLALSRQTLSQPLSILSAATETFVSTNNPVGITSPSHAISTSPFTPFTQTPTPKVLFDFVLEADKAAWESNETFDPDDQVYEDCDLAFGTPSLSSCGFARWESAALEDGASLPNVLVVEPYHANGGEISGTYDLTGLTLSQGARLLTVVGFLQAAETLGVAFQVSFTTGDANFDPVLVYTTRDRKDGQLIEAVTPLPDELIGKSGYFILQVLAAPNTNANWASWVVARLEQP